MKKTICPLIALCVISLTTHTQAETFQFEESFKGTSSPQRSTTIDNGEKGDNKIPLGDVKISLGIATTNGSVEFAENNPHSKIDCHSNPIKRKEMKKLLASIPNKSLLSLLDGTEEKNNTPITLPYTEDFEACSAGALPKGWTTKDIDGDGHNWQTNEFLDDPKAGRRGSHRCAVSASFDPDKREGLTPRNELISPNVNGIKSLNYYVAATDPDDFAEHYKVFSSTAANPTEKDWVKLFEETLTEDLSGGKTGVEDTFGYREMNVPEGTQWIKFVHTDCTGYFYVRIDDITFSPYLKSIEGIEVEKVKLKTEKGLIIIDTPTAGATLTLFDFAGQSVVKLTSVKGENRVMLPTGYYVLSLGSYKAKVYIP